MQSSPTRSMPLEKDSCADALNPSAGTGSAKSGDDHRVAVGGGLAQLRCFLVSLGLVPRAGRIDGLEFQHHGLVTGPGTFDDLGRGVHRENIDTTHRCSGGSAVSLHAFRILDGLREDDVTLSHNAVNLLIPARFWSAFGDGLFGAAIDGLAGGGLEFRWHIGIYRLSVAIVSQVEHIRAERDTHAMTATALVVDPDFHAGVNSKCSSVRPRRM